jgi:hypothetical protein
MQGPGYACLLSLFVYCDLYGKLAYPFGGAPVGQSTLWNKHEILSWYVLFNLLLESISNDELSLTIMTSNATSKGHFLISLNVDLFKMPSRTMAL